MKKKLSFTKESTHTLWELKSKFTKTDEYKVNIKKSNIFYILATYI